MKQRLAAEIHILDRITHMLEEGSVNYLATQNPDFRKFITRVYGTVGERRDQLTAKGQQ